MNEDRFASNHSFFIYKSKPWDASYRTTGISPAI